MAFFRKYRRQILLGGAIVFIVLFLVPSYLIRSHPISAEELRKLMFVPPEDVPTVVLFITKDCGICNQVLQNVTEAIRVAQNITNMQIVLKVFECQSLTVCNNREAYINFRVYGVSQVPAMFIFYRGLMQSVDPTALPAKRLGELLAAWIITVQHAWLPGKGLYVVYFYDGNHTSPYVEEIKTIAKNYGAKFVEMGCRLYPQQCSNITVRATMTILGIRPQDLPLVIVFKDGRAIFAVRPLDAKAVEALAGELSKLK